MVITKLLAKPLDKVLLYVDEEPISQISLNSIAKYDIYVNKEISEDILEEILTQDLAQTLFDKSIRYSSISPKTEKQFRTHIEKIIKENEVHLEEKIINTVTEDTIQKLKDYDYINDRQYAEEFVLSRVRNKPKGKQSLIYELVGKGIDKDLAEEIVEDSVLDEYDLLKKSFYKKYKSYAISFEDSKKISFLQRNGFSWDLIEQFIRENS
ncbi:RecX family transcriptional regulator [bacterium]|nr:RecX family transcriptional regulator [bacterium]